MEIEHLKNIRDQITALDKNQQHEIFKIVKKNESNRYTENNNGIFINMNKLDTETIKNIESFLEFSRQNKEIFELETENLNEN
jgi:hypothetical protein